MRKNLIIVFLNIAIIVVIMNLSAPLTYARAGGGSSGGSSSSSGTGGTTHSRNGSLWKK